MTEEERLPAPCHLHPAPCHPAPCTLPPSTQHLPPCTRTLHPAPCTLHPAPCTLHPAPCHLHPAPRTPHPATCTLHPAPCTLMNLTDFTPRVHRPQAVCGLWQPHILASPGQSLKLNELIHFRGIRRGTPDKQTPLQFFIRQNLQSLPDQRLIACQRNALRAFSRALRRRLAVLEGTFSSGSDRAGVLSSGEKAKTPRRSKQNSFTSESNS